LRPEVIVADDASTDPDPAIAQKWRSNPRFRYYRSRENIGRTANYRRLLHRLARGKWALTLDGDDHLTDPGFVSAAWNAVQRNGGDRVAFAMAGHHIWQWRTGDRFEQKPSIEGQEQVMDGGEYPKLSHRLFMHLSALYNRRPRWRDFIHGYLISDMESFCGSR
jgi:glycosyltransferase involved in cell wall biosynthesis